MFDFWRRLKWTELKEEDVPPWVLKADNSFYESYDKHNGHRPYNIVTYFNGRTFRYKIWYECVGQAQIRTHYYRKKR